MDEQEKTPEAVKAAADRRDALTAEAKPDADAVRSARSQAPRGRTERPTSTAG